MIKGIYVEVEPHLYYRKQVNTVPSAPPMVSVTPVQANPCELPENYDPEEPNEDVEAGECIDLAAVR